MVKLSCTLQVGKIKEGVDKAKQELKDAVEQSSKGLNKQIAKAGAGWVRDSDVQQVVKVGAACDSYTSTHNSSAPGGLQLNVTDRLVAPVVILAHARANYLAKTVLELYR